ncbi:MAG: ABC transporter permease [Alphaproteobacteria bacterium]|nr:ABC transporter permease [Alphaproteobacteria bacterium]
MSKRLLSRIGQSLVILLLVSAGSYGLIGLMPGDPIDLMIQADPRLTPEDAARLKALEGLDRPLPERYADWLWNALQGDFGQSRLYKVPVADVLVPRLGSTLLLLGLAMVLALAVAIPAGVLAAAKPRGVTDRAINLACFAGVSIPPFWLALLLILVFAVGLGWLPASGAPPAGRDTGFGDHLLYLVMPVAALSVSAVASYARHVRSAMIEAMTEDWVRTARAKGASRARVLWRHGLRNALLPVTTLVALDIGTLFSGALIVETVFARPGMGKLIYDAILGNDYNLAMIGLTLATAVTLAANLGADALYGRLDPRVRTGGGSGL